MEIFHKHHIVPKYMGGSNHPSNLIALTIPEHADAHKKLYEQHGNIEDYLAWKGLSGCIDNSEINYLRSKIAGYKSKGRIKSIEECEKLSASWTKERKEQLSKLSKQRFAGKQKSEEHIKKMKERKPSSESVKKMKETQIKNNYGGKKIQTPFGIFQSLKDCSRKIGINNRTLKYRASKEIMGYKFLNEGTL